MLTAITSGKAGRIELNGVEQRVSWRDVFRRSEDLLTAVFFSRLRFLSRDLLTKVMALLIGKAAAETLGRLETLEFWPRLENLEGRGWVEPDLLIWFEKALVVVEIKPPFGGCQYLRQWEDQIHALVAEAECGERELPTQVYFLALGQNQAHLTAQAEASIQTRSLFNLEIHTQEWAELVSALGDLDNQLDGPDGAVFSDWRSAFELFGMYQAPKAWEPLADRCINVSLSLLCLQPWIPVSHEENLPSLAVMTKPGQDSWVPLLDYIIRSDLNTETLR